jgi:chorismate mutase / prephenate dehydratase
MLQTVTRKSLMVAPLHIGNMHDRLDDSHQTKPTVGYLGPDGSFTGMAAKKYFGEANNFVPLPGHKVASWVVLDRKAVGTHQQTYAVLAVENIVHGFIESTFHALYNTAGVEIVGQIYLPIRFALISRAKDLEGVRTICSHEAGLSQCRHHIDVLEKVRGIKVSRASVASTSEAVRNAAADPTVAALGSADAAALYDVPVVDAAFQDHAHNSTRFWVIAPRASAPSGHRATKETDRTVFLVELADTATSLFECMSLIKSCGVSISWMKPHIIPHKSSRLQWRYCYFIECIGGAESDGIKQLHRALKRTDLKAFRDRSGRMLGSFSSRNP